MGKCLFLTVAKAAAVLLVFGFVLRPTIAEAGCGCMMRWEPPLDTENTNGEADASIYNDASIVVLMRHGNTTVVSMQNEYSGPPSQFALIIPVPVVLQEDQVKTLEAGAFGHIDRFAAPRLVKYWEKDPCDPRQHAPRDDLSFLGQHQNLSATSARPPVRVEAQFAVGEYDMSVLGADDSSALGAWLRRENYNVSAGAEAILRPYVAAGMKFFVAKVDPSRVDFSNGRAVLSPIRFHYESDEFSLPVRLGTLNSRGHQDVLIHILGESRYEVANYPNATIPTNVVVPRGIQQRFPGFYRGLFERTILSDPTTVVTEYASSATECDRCNVRPLNEQALLTLGRDVVAPQRLVLTRLHARVGANTHAEDLVFREAPALRGGTGMPEADLEAWQGVEVGGERNHFMARYLILRPWTATPRCEAPRWGVWGQARRRRNIGLGSSLAAARAIPVDLTTWNVDVVWPVATQVIAAQEPPPAEETLIASDEPEVALEQSQTEEVSASPQSPVAVPASQAGCASCATSSEMGTYSAPVAMLVCALLLVGRRRRF